MPATIPPLERLLAHSPRARIIWDLTGTNYLGDFTLARIGAMLDRYPNLYLSLKIAGPETQSANKIFAGKGLDSAWRDLLTRHEDRFVVGTGSVYGGGSAVGVIAGFTKATEARMRATKQLLSMLPEGAAREIGRENARRLYGL